MEEKKRNWKTKKKTKKKEKKHIKIFILYCCSLVRADLCDSLCTIFLKKTVCVICLFAALDCWSRIGTIPPWCCCTDHILSPFLSLSLARSLALIFHFVSAFFSTGQARQNEANSSQLSIKKSCHFVYYLLVSFSFTRFENRLKYNQQYIMCVMQTRFLIPFLPKYFIKFVPVEAIQQIGYNL